VTSTARVDLDAAASDLDARLAGQPYQGYLYAYPHKTAYRAFAAPKPLRELWAEERKDALFLYLHVPFCEFRCGFCNLFTQTNPAEGLAARFMDTLARQAERMGAALGEAGFARLALGGGTPTWLEAADLARLFDLAEGLGADPSAIPVSVESSPDTATAERLAVLRERGTTRLSVGVQSFVEAECRASGRPQTTAAVEAALGGIRDAGFPVLNLDLIYGLPGQTPATWRTSLDAALAWEPEELFLYPLYVRPLTGLDRIGTEPAPGDVRLALYRQGRDLLLDRGYEQVSMRLFRKPGAGDGDDAPAYCCQEDGMVGLGAGARSYTRSVHYASEYAVGARGVKAITAAWVERSAESFDAADYGFTLDAEEQRRRYAIQSLLHKTGLDPVAYARRFGTDASDDLPQLGLLQPRGLARDEGGVLRLTAEGLERSDVLGPWLISPAVWARMEEYELR
jgi:oxygen-independent coproporphyrinogen-3 oxidase